MTNTKAIETLEYIRHTGNGESSYNHDVQSIALDMAIEALKAEPCGDAVSREAALDAVHDAYINAYDIKSLIKDSMQFIKDLPPVTPKITECEDAVSRQAVLKLTRAERIFPHLTDDLMSSIKNVIFASDVKTLPPVTPKPRMGKWIEFRHEEWANNIYIKCSECGKIYHRDEKEFNFCPNCGAKMEAESEEV